MTAAAVLSSSEDKSERNKSHKENVKPTTTAAIEEEIPSAEPVTEEPEESTEVYIESETEAAEENDYAAECEAAAEQAEIFLTAIKNGDIATFADMLAEESDDYDYFQDNRDNEQLAEIFRLFYGDMVWTTNSSTNEHIVKYYDGSEQNLRVIMTVGSRRQIDIDFTALYAEGLAVGDEIHADSLSVDSDEDARAVLETYVPMVPLEGRQEDLLVADASSGSFKFYIGEDFSADPLDMYRLFDLSYYGRPSQLSWSYVAKNLVSLGEGVVNDPAAPKAKFEDNDEFRGKYMQLLREKKLDEAWSFVKPLLEQEINGRDDTDLEKNALYQKCLAIESYDSLTEAQKAFVDQCVEKTVIFAPDITTDPGTDHAARRGNYKTAYPLTEGVMVGADCLEWSLENNLCDIRMGSMNDGVNGNYYDILVGNTLACYANIIKYAAENL